MPKDQPAGAFDSTVSHAVPDGDSDSRIPQTPAESATPAAGAAKHLQFSARVDPELLRQVKIEVATRGTTMQAATAEAFRLWLSSK